MSDKLTTKQAIEQVLKGKTMKVPAIIKAAVPLTNLGGKTPGQTIYSVLYAENKKPDGLFTQVDRGTFKMNPNRKKAAKAKAPKADGKPARAPRKPKLEEQVAAAEAEHAIDQPDEDDAAVKTVR